MAVSTQASPYEPGNFLELLINQETFIACIKTAFWGSDTLQFTNSCTVLIEIDATSIERLQRILRSTVVQSHMVLKVFDPQYSALIRDDFCCNPISQHDFSNETPPYSSVFHQKLPQELLHTQIVQSCVFTHLVGPEPTYGDIIKMAMQIPEHQSKLIEQGVLVRDVTNADREHYLRLICQDLCEHELRVLNITQAIKTSPLPLLYGSGTVLSFYRIQNDHKQPIFASAILMEYLPGVSLRTWLAEHVDKLKKNNLETTAIRDEIYDIAAGIFEALHTLMYCGLASSDTRLDNVNVYHPTPDGRPTVRLYDAGGSLLVPRIHNCQYICRRYHPQIIGVDAQQLNKSCLFSSSDALKVLEHTQSYFGPRIERDATALVQILNQSLRARGETILGDLQLSTDCFEAFDEVIDTICWQTIMLCFWYFDDLQEAIKMVPQTLEVMRNVRYILNITQTQSSTELAIPRRYWAFVALARACQVYCHDDYLQAVSKLAESLYRLLQSIEQEGEDDLRTYYHAHPDLPLRLFFDSRPVEMHAWRLRNVVDRSRIDFNADDASQFNLDISRIIEIVTQQEKKYPTRLSEFSQEEEFVYVEDITWFDVLDDDDCSEEGDICAGDRIDPILSV